MSDPFPVITFRVNLDLSRTEDFGPLTNQTQPRVLHPDRFQSNQDNAQFELQNRKNTRSTWDAGLLAGSNRQMKHGEVFTAAGLRAVYIRDQYAIGFAADGSRAVLEVIDVQTGDPVPTSSVSSSASSTSSKSSSATSSSSVSSTSSKSSSTTSSSSVSSTSSKSSSATSSSSNSSTSSESSSRSSSSSWSSSSSSQSSSSSSSSSSRSSSSESSSSSSSQSSSSSS